FMKQLSLSFFFICFFVIIGAVSFSQTGSAQTLQPTNEKQAEDSPEGSKKKKDEAPRSLFNDNTIERHQPIIFALGRPNTKVQISLKARMLEALPIYFGYTQLIFWQLEEESKPFFDASYSPQFFYRTYFYE